MPSCKNFKKFFLVMMPCKASCGRNFFQLNSDLLLTRPVGRAYQEDALAPQPRHALALSTLAKAPSCLKTWCAWVNGALGTMRITLVRLRPSVQEVDCGVDHW